MTTHLVNVFTDTATNTKGTATGKYYEGSMLVKWSGGHQVPDGYAVFFECQPNAGYAFDYWLTAAGAKIWTPSFDRTITGFFGATAFFTGSDGNGGVTSNVTFGVEGQGTVEPLTAAPYYVGGNLDVSAIPTANWEYTHFKRNGVVWSGENPAEFLNLQAAESIVAVFVPIPTPPPNGGDGGINVVQVVGAVSVLAIIGYGLYRLLRKGKRGRES